MLSVYSARFTKREPMPQTSIPTMAYTAVLCLILLPEAAAEATRTAVEVAFVVRGWARAFGAALLDVAVLGARVVVVVLKCIQMGCL